MRNSLPLLAALLITGALASGCANVEKKFGRGMSNMFDIVRGGEFRRTMEQTGTFDGPDAAYGAGFFRGINRTLARTENAMTQEHVFLAAELCLQAQAMAVKIEG